jgi:hypothetical protein
MKNCCCQLVGTSACLTCPTYLEVRGCWRGDMYAVGWICPRCGRVNAPNVVTCLCEPANDLGVTWVVTYED